MGLVLSVNSSYTDILTSVFSTAIAAKAWFATAAIVLALVQITTAARIYGKLPRVIRLPGHVISPIHRWSGRLAFLCTLPVAFHCIFILGFQTNDWRVYLHCILGSFVYGVFAVKVLFVRTAPTRAGCSPSPAGRCSLFSPASG